MHTLNVERVVIAILSINLALGTTTREVHCCCCSKATSEKETAYIIVHVVNDKQFNKNVTTCKTCVQKKNQSISFTLFVVGV